MEEPGLDTGDHVTAKDRYAAAAAQLKGRDKLDREQLRELRQQMRAEKKVRLNPENNLCSHATQNVGHVHLDRICA